MIRLSMNRVQSLFFLPKIKEKNYKLKYSNKKNFTIGILFQQRFEYSHFKLQSKLFFSRGFGL